MKLVSFRQNGRQQIGALVEGGIVALQAAYAAVLGGDEWAYRKAQALIPDDMVLFLQGGGEALQAAQEALAYTGKTGPRGERLLWAEEDVELLAPVPRPTKIICIGLNYKDHAAESGAELPVEPVLFSKYPTAVVGPGQAIRLPEMSKEVDYEAELAFVIGTGGKNIPAEKALDHVAGYTCFNDISARDLQFRDGQWMKGKTPDTFAPTGPALVTADEVGDPGKLAIKLELNGQVMQSSNTDQLIFPVPELIAFLSRLVTLEPGDVVATGTPSGVGFARKPPVFLKDGDTVTVEIEKLGRLTNPVVAD